MALLIRPSVIDLTKVDAYAIFFLITVGAKIEGTLNKYLLLY